MMACSTVGGGVMFIPETLERKERVMSYEEFAELETSKPRGMRLFGRRTEIVPPKVKVA